jgi:hypothetical protein
METFACPSLQQLEPAWQQLPPSEQQEPSPSCLAMETFTCPSLQQPEPAWQQLPPSEQQEPSPSCNGASEPFIRAVETVIIARSRLLQQPCEQDFPDSAAGVVAPTEQSFVPQRLS